MAKEYTRADFDRLWTWQSHGFFANYWNAHEVGEEFTIENPINTVKKGDTICVGEFDGAELKRARAQDPDTLIGKFMTGRLLVLQCLDKKPDSHSMLWGMPQLTKRGAATFKVLDKQEDGVVLTARKG